MLIPAMPAPTTQISLVMSRSSGLSGGPSGVIHAEMVRPESLSMPLHIPLPPACASAKIEFLEIKTHVPIECKQHNTWEAVAWWIRCRTCRGHGKTSGGGGG